MPRPGVRSSSSPPTIFIQRGVRTTLFEWRVVIETTAVTTFGPTNSSLSLMRHKFLAFLVLAMFSLAFSEVASAQRNVSMAIERDPILEADAKHNLDVAQNAFKLKKAYKGVLMRFEETYAAYPDFSKIDEFLYIAGMASYYLSEGKGNQKIDPKTEKNPEKYEPSKLKEDAVAYLSTILEKYPESKYRDDAEKALAELKTKTWAAPTSQPPPVLSPKRLVVN
jgi:hypothetical protein